MRRGQNLKPAALLLALLGPVLPDAGHALGPGGLESESAARRGEPRVVAPREVPGVDWLQFNFDSRHSGNNGLEWRITRENVSSLRRVYKAPLIDIADGSPAYLARVSTSRGARDLLFATSVAGFVAAYDACDGSRAWFRAPASGPLWTTSSPAVDPNRQYLYTYQLDGFVHKLRVGDGSEVREQGWPQLSTKKPDVEKGSSDLSLAVTSSGRRFLYATSSGYPGPGPGDQGDYQGHVTAIDLDRGTQTVFNTLCSDRQIHFDESALAGDCPHVRAAVWGRAGVTYDPVSDRVLFSTGNGDFDAGAGGHEWGDSVLSLAPDLTGPTFPLDSYTPSNYAELDLNDLDLGSSTPFLLPDLPGGLGPRLAIQSGKDGRVRLLNLSDLSGQGGPGHVGGELQVEPLPQGGEVLTDPTAWIDPVDGSRWFFVANDGGISGFRVLDDPAGTGGPNPRVALQWKRDRGGTTPIMANGVLYYAGSGFIAALDPRSGEDLWSDTEIGPIHWQSPILVNGVLYMTDNTPAVVAYAPGGVIAPRSDGPCH